jgi:uncharacterized protein VirK/YbjX
MSTNQDPITLAKQAEKDLNSASKMKPSDTSKFEDDLSHSSSTNRLLQQSILELMHLQRRNSLERQFKSVVKVEVIIERFHLKKVVQSIQ